MASGDDDRRYSPNLQGLLKFCLEATKADDNTEASQFSEMDEERRKWLQEALTHMTVDVIKRMKECCVKLLKDDEHSIEEREEALEHLIDLCDDIDLAKDFQKIGGFSLLPKLLDDPSGEIQWRTGELIATLVQNNPYCQQAAMQVGVLPMLLKLTDSHSLDMVRIKSMYAISGLCRHVPETEQAFVELDGFSYLLRAMQSNIEKLQIKAVFLLMYFCSPAFKDVLCNMGMVEQLVTLLGTQHGPFHEHLLATLVSMVNDHQKSLDECRRPELGLQAILENKLKQLKNDETHLEEMEYSKRLMELAFKDKSEAACR